MQPSFLSIENENNKLRRKEEFICNDKKNSEKIQ